MASVPHGNFVPHSSPLSVSYSYGPRSSPMPQNNEKNKDGEVCYTNEYIFEEFFTGTLPKRRTAITAQSHNLLQDLRIRPNLVSNDSSH